jgi:hypothetical protein
MRTLTDSELDAVAGLGSIRLNLQSAAALVFATGNGASVSTTGNKLTGTAGTGTGGFAFGLLDAHFGGSITDFILTW